MSCFSLFSWWGSSNMANHGMFYCECCSTFIHVLRVFVVLYAYHKNSRAQVYMSLVMVETTIQSEES